MVSHFVFMIMTLLAVGFLSVRLATWLKIPHSVLLVLLGIATGLWVRQHGPETLDLFRNFFPQLILYILLPPLIFESAFHMNFKALKKDIAPISALAVAGLGVSTACVGYGLHWAFGLPLLPSLTFGALISATDPIAVVALFREVGAPQRLTTLIEGESLLNDGTAMVLFRLFLAVVLSSGSFEGSAVLWGFTWLTVGSLGVGLVIAVFTQFLLRFVAVSGVAQLGITVVSAYLSFILSDAFLHLSGVITTLVVGLYLGHRIRTEYNLGTFNGIQRILEFLALSANILVFLAVGMTFNPGSIIENWAFIPFTLMIVYFARALSIALTVPTLTFACKTVLMWGGLRGGLALGLVLTLPIQFPNRDLFIALAVSVVLATLIVNALTTRKILQLLGLDQLNENDQHFFEKALQMILAEASELSIRFVDHQTVLTHPIHVVNTDVVQTDLQFELISLLSTERHTYELRFEEGTLSRSTYLDLVESVASRRDLFDQQGMPGLKAYELSLNQRLKWSERFLFFFRSRSVNRLLKKLISHLEFLLHLKTALEIAKCSANQFETRELYQRWIVETQQSLGQFYRHYSHYYKTVQSMVVAQTHHAISLRSLAQLYQAKTISQAVYAKLQNELTIRHDAAKDTAMRLLRPSTSYLLGRIPIFQHFSRVTLRKLAETSPIRVVDIGKTLIKEGEDRHSLFIIIAGVLKLAGSNSERGQSEERLFFPGDFFGTRSLLHGEPQRATLRAEVATEILEITQTNLEFVFHEYPILKKRLLEEKNLSDSLNE